MAAGSLTVPNNTVKYSRLCTPLVARWVLQGQRRQNSGSDEEGPGSCARRQQVPSGKAGGEPPGLLLSPHLPLPIIWLTEFLPFPSPVSNFLSCALKPLCNTRCFLRDSWQKEDVSAASFRFAGGCTRSKRRTIYLGERNLFQHLNFDPQTCGLTQSRIFSPS